MNEISSSCEFSALSHHHQHRSTSFNSLISCLNETWGDLPLRVDDSEDMVIYNFLRDAVCCGWSPLDLSTSTTTTSSTTTTTTITTSVVKAEPKDELDLEAEPIKLVQESSLNMEAVVTKKIGSNEPDPVRITAKRRQPDTGLTAVDTGSAKMRKMLVDEGDELERGVGYNVFQVGHRKGLMPVGEQLLAS
uniref:Ethylene-responsive transcription factor 2-like n=1 Tax=Populus alba TaxID=43335 RepID=A0A4U5P337_POPAL|nr:ethylene-responsive transcription factor 2-like [Populus alba]